MVQPHVHPLRQRLLLAAGIALSALGLTVCAGWLLELAPIVQVQAGLVSMKFNTALLFLLTGVSIILWTLNRRTASTIIAAAALVFSGLIVAQYPLGRSLGVDTLFDEPFLVRPGETPGRISPYTSSAFVALMLGMLAARRSITRPAWFFTALILCASVQLLTCAQLVGYATGHRLPLAGGTSMAVHTALGLLTAAWAVLGVNWPDTLPRRRGAFNILLLTPVAASIFGVVTALWVLAALPGNGESGPNPPVLPMITSLAVAAAIAAAGFIAARVGFDRAATLQTANQRLVEEISYREQLESAQRLLVAELDHRVRNTLSQVLSLAESTAQGVKDVGQFNLVFSDRIRALSRAHSVLAASRWQDVDLRSFLTAVLEPFVVSDKPRIHLAGDPVTVPSRATTPLCMVYYELAANAARHGALLRPGGWVELEWRRILNGSKFVEITWRERAGPTVAASPREGFGLSLIRSMIPHELGGRTELTFHPDGVECIVSFPVGAAVTDPPTVRVAC